jgi:hypothetical protein
MSQAEAKLLAYLILKAKKYHLLLSTEQAEMK